MESICIMRTCESVCSTMLHDNVFGLYDDIVAQWGFTRIQTGYSNNIAKLAMIRFIVRLNCLGIYRNLFSSRLSIDYMFFAASLNELVMLLRFLLSPVYFHALTSWISDTQLKISIRLLPPKAIVDSEEHIPRCISRLFLSFRLCTSRNLPPRIVSNGAARAFQFYWCTRNALNGAQWNEIETDKVLSPRISYRSNGVIKCCRHSL